MAYWSSYNFKLGEQLCKTECCVDKKLIFISITLDFNRIHCKIAENQRSYKKWEWRDEQVALDAVEKKSTTWYSLVV